MRFVPEFISIMKLIHSIQEYFTAHPTLQKGTYLAFAFFCLTPYVSAPLALVLGFLMMQFVGNPFQNLTQELTAKLLKISVVGLGFGMNVNSALNAGKEGFVFTVVSIFSLLIVGYLLTKVFKIDQIIGYLISAGTAICGGSAIAAIAPIVKAKPNQISMALAVVFTLNSIALLIFPFVGNFLDMSQHRFGMWCAIAIHDTSSVVGAASKYGMEALEVATTVKLARALWIIPLSFLSVALFKNKENKVKIPWFIAFFVLAMILSTYIPFVQKMSPTIVTFSKAGLNLTLFLIGSGLSFAILKTIGAKPIVMAVLLWLFISIGTLMVLLM